MERELRESKDKETKAYLLKKYSKLNSPVAFLSAIVDENLIGTPQANLYFRNISNNVIDGIEVDIYCFDNFNRKVNHYLYQNNKFSGISQDVINPQEDDSVAWTLYGYDNTTKMTVILRSIHFKNGKKWTPSNTISIKSE